MGAEYKRVIGKSVIPQGPINGQQNYERQNYFLYMHGKITFISSKCKMFC